RPGHRRQAAGRDAVRRGAGSRGRDAGDAVAWRGAARGRRLDAGGAAGGGRRGEGARHRMTRRAWALDVAVALVAAGLEVGRVSESDGSRPPVAVGFAFAAGAVLVWRRRAPLATLGVSLAAVCAVAIAGATPAGFAPLVALYTVASRRERGTSL